MLKYKEKFNWFSQVFADNVLSLTHQVRLLCILLLAVLALKKHLKLIQN